MLYQKEVSSILSFLLSLFTFYLLFSISVASPPALGLCFSWPPGTYYTPGYALGVHASGSIAYVAVINPGSLQIIDASDPSNPTLLGGYNTPDQALGVYVTDNTAYVAN